MAEFFNPKMEACEEEQAAYVLLPINEYNGLKKVLRLYYQKKDQKEKEKGRFKVLEQKFEKYQDGRSRFLTWSTTLNLPYFNDFNAKEVLGIAKSDLESYLGIIRVFDDIRDLDKIESTAAIEYQNFIFSKNSLQENDFAIFYAGIKYNGRNSQYELTIKSLKEIPIDLIESIP